MRVNILCDKIIIKCVFLIEFSTGILWEIIEIFINHFLSKSLHIYVWTIKKGIIFIFKTFTTSMDSIS